MPRPARPWYRFYSETLTSRKAQKLKPNMFKHWVNLLCLANVQLERGTLPCMPDIAYALRLTEDVTADIVEELVTLLFIDPVGDGFVMHDWEEWQKDRDVAPAQRTGKRDVSVINITETPRIQRTTRDVSVTRGEVEEEKETDVEEEKIDPRASLGWLPKHDDEGFIQTYREKYEQTTGSPITGQRTLAAGQIEKTYGAAACSEVANALGWDKSPKYYIGALEELRNGIKPRKNAGQPRAAPGANPRSRAEEARAILARR